MRSWSRWRRARRTHRRPAWRAPAPNPLPHPTCLLSSENHAPIRLSKMACNCCSACVRSASDSVNFSCRWMDVQA